MSKLEIFRLRNRIKELEQRMGRLEVKLKQESNSRASQRETLKALNERLTNFTGGKIGRSGDVQWLRNYLETEPLMKIRVRRIRIAARASDMGKRRLENALNVLKEEGVKVVCLGGGRAVEWYWIMPSRMDDLENEAHDRGVELTIKG